MLTYVYARDLVAQPLLARTMFEDRADQFSTRLGWEVSVDAQGQERDEYDALNPLYVICRGTDGRHQGSMRLLPMSGPTMIADHFPALEGGKPIRRPDIWECTRFCLARQAGPQVASALMLAGGEVMRRLNIRHYLGIFDRRMIRIYRRIGASPQVLASQGTGTAQISLGLWSFDDHCHRAIMQRNGIAQTDLDLWFDSSLGQAELGRVAVRAQA